MAEADSIAIGRRCTVCGEFKQADQFNKAVADLERIDPGDW